MRPGSQFFNSISLKLPVSINKLFEQAKKYSAYEDDLVVTSKPAMTIDNETARSRRTSSQYKRASQDNCRSIPGRGSIRYSNKRKDPTNEGGEVKFTLPLEKILQQTCKEAEFKWPTPPRRPMDERDMGKLCGYHRDHGHNMK